jgi:hypothetical protein
MARTRRPAPPAPIILTASSVHATIGPPPATEAVAMAVGGRSLDLTSLQEYEPPPLPAPTATAAATGATFRVAAAAPASALPDVQLTYDTSRRVWRLLADYSYVYDGVTLTARAGYSYDLASVPRPLWWLIAPNELSLVAPLFHDLLYEFRGVLPEGNVEPYRTYTRREADDLFLHLMEVEGIAWWRRNAAYSAVRAAGWTYWDT